MPESHAGGSDRKSRETVVGASNVAAIRDEPDPTSVQVMEAVVARENLLNAYSRVMSNKGAAGVDKMTVEQLKPYLQQHWATIKGALLKGDYQPQAVRLVEIEKLSGGMRQLGIPTVVDRLIQQALHQVLSPLFEPGFSESSYGFRPSRNAHQAVAQARAYVGGGRRWVVDLDLEKFFDRVNHDILMARVARKVKDKRVLRLIRRYLQAGMMSGGIVSSRGEGTPQGGPLSPLLSNILLDELDKELERRGHKFVRYADDCNIYVRSRAAGERVMASVSQYLGQRLCRRVNEEKSAVARPWERKFLGYSMTWHKQPRLKVAGESVKRLKIKLRMKIREAKGRNLEKFIEELEPVLRGWINYYRLAEVKGIIEELDGWLRRKLRSLLWRRWKRPLRRAKNLMKRGLAEARAWRSATNGRGPWWNAGASHLNEAYPKSYFDRLGLVSLIDSLRRLQRA
ncbi:MAG: group II intron reverse transcriptase/maturase [Acidobacteriota bacterium]